MLKPGSVIQLNEKSRWMGCLAIVGSVTQWGVKGSMIIPGSPEAGLAPIRLAPEEFHDLGVVAPIIPPEVYGLEEIDLGHVASQGNDVLRGIEANTIPDSSLDSSLDRSRSSFGHEEERP